jgi:hypothetical protein
MDLITLAVGALATHRVTRLITRDRITAAPRRWTLNRLDEHGLLAYLITCDWCVSVYVGAGAALTGASIGAWSWTWAAPLAFAYSSAAGHLASREGEE